MPLSPRTLRPVNNAFTPRSISGLALWLDASSTGDLYTTDAGPVTAVSSPTEISGCLCWYDASDATSITKDGSNLVSQWNDKSGNLRHATASGSLRPTSGGSQNGRTVMQFTGTQGMTITGNFLQSDNVTMFAVAMKNADHYGGIISSAPTNPEDSPLLGYYSSTIAFINRRQVVQSAAANGAYRLICGQSIGTTQRAHFEGLQGTDGTASVSTATGNTVTKIGAFRTSESGNLNGNIAEIICYSGNLSTADRARVESYLAAKWGISGVHAQATATSDPVGYWRDRSGNNRHATQATAGNRPIVGTQNDRKSLTFDGVNDNLKHIPTSTIGANAITFMSVIRHNLTTQPTFLCGPVDLSHSNSYRPIGRHQSTSSNRLFVGGTLAEVSAAYRSQPDRFVHTLDGQRDAAGASVHAVREFFNGASVATGSISTTWSTADQKLNIGTREDNGVQYKGDICESLVYDRLLTAAERQRLERYLAAKWGITLAPQVSNADAQDWVNRVFANGGTVSASTASAVNTFCDAIDAAGIRSLMYRANLFCGTGLNAALVPLYRGPSLSGTQYGNTTDTNVGGLFVAGDYNETGASGGLLGNGSSKYLNTGLATNALPSVDTGHLSVYAMTGFGGSTIYALLSTLGPAYAENYCIESNRDPGGLVGLWGKGSAFSTLATSAQGAGNGHVVVTRTGGTTLSAYRNGSFLRSNNTSVTPAATASPFYVYGHNPNSTTGAAPLNYALARMGGYSIGLQMDATQAAAYYNAMQTFQTALGRNV